MNTKPPFQKGDRVRILMDEPLPHSRLYTPDGKPCHPWAKTNGWPPYQEFVVGEYACWSKDWAYEGPDGACWYEEDLELATRRATRFERIMQAKDKS